MPITQISETKSPIYKLTSIFIKFTFVIIFLILVIRTFIIDLVFVPTGAMKPTVLEDYYIIATKYSYGYSKYSLPFSSNIISGRILATQPQRGDLVIFYPPHNMDTLYIKRLIGMPGDQIQLINDVIYINDKATGRTKVGTDVSEDGKNYLKYKEILPNGAIYFSYKLSLQDLSSVNSYSNTPVFYVPKDNYFFLGDNRDESGDSRMFWSVPFENFVAKGQFVVFSTKEILQKDNIGSVKQTSTTSVRFERLFRYLYKTN